MRKMLTLPCADAGMSGRGDCPTTRGEIVPTMVPIDESLFTWPADEPQLRGGRCTSCGAVAFPQPPSCARCTSTDVAEELLPRQGTLWSWTVQRFAPKEPYLLTEAFEPYGVGYVDLGDVVVESRLTTADPELLWIGEPMELQIVPFAPGGDGEQLATFAFAPAIDQEVPQR